MSNNKENSLVESVLIETALLKALSIKTKYDQYSAYVNFDRLLPQTKVILNDFDRYFSLYPNHEEVQFDTFITQFTNNWHTTDMNKQDLLWYTEALIRISQSDQEDAERAMLGLINKQFLAEVNNICDRPFQPEEVQTLLDKYVITRANVLQEFDKDCFKLEDIDLASANPEGGIPYAWERLQNKLVGQVPGDVIVLNAYHGLGKTAMMLTQAVHTFKYIHKNNLGPILYFNSEGSPAQVFGRFLSCLYKDNIPGGYLYIVQNQEKIKNHFFKNFRSDLLHIYRSNGRGFGFIRDKILKYKPSVVYIDMLKGAASAPRHNISETSNLEVLAQQLRDISSSTCPIWLTVQAGDSACFYDKTTQTKKPKRWIDSADIYGSKTGIQGAASTIISIGMDEKRPLTRFIQTTKIKAEENAKFVCELDKKHSFYKEVDWDYQEYYHDEPADYEKYNTPEYGTEDKPF